LKKLKRAQKIRKRGEGEEEVKLGRDI
jgi:hypothetical protein